MIGQSYLVEDELLEEVDDFIMDGIPHCWDHKLPREDCHACENAIARWDQRRRTLHDKLWDL